MGDFDVGQEIAKAAVGIGVTVITSLAVAGRSLLKRFKEFDEKLAELGRGHLALQAAHDADARALATFQAAHEADLNELEEKFDELRRDISNDLKKIDEALSKQIDNLGDSAHDLADKAEVARFMTEVNQACLRLAEKIARIEGMFELAVERSRALPGKPR